MSDDGPFTDDMIRSMLERQKMQHQIIPHIEEMAQKLAAAGVASYQVTGDAPDYAVRRWVDVLRNRALELLRENMRSVREKEQKSLLGHQKLLDKK